MKYTTSRIQNMVLKLWIFLQTLKTSWWKSGKDCSTGPNYPWSVHAQLQAKRGQYNILLTINLHHYSLNNGPTQIYLWHISVELSKTAQGNTRMEVFVTNYFAARWFFKRRYLANKSWSSWIIAIFCSVWLNITKDFQNIARGGNIIIGTTRRLR